MAFPLGTNAKLYNELTRQNNGKPPTCARYNEGVRYCNAAGGNLSEFDCGAVSGGPITRPAEPAVSGVPQQAVGTIGDWTVTPTGEWLYQGQPVSTGRAQPTQLAQPIVTTPGGQPAQAYNPALYEFEQSLALQQAADNAAMERARLAAQTQQAATAAQAQISAEQNRAMLERLRYQVGQSLQQALMSNDLNQAKLTMDVAQMAADPRSAVGFLEFLGQAGGGPTAISQQLAAGIEPSPVWEYFPETETMGPEAQRLYQTLEGFISGIGG